MKSCYWSVGWSCLNGIRVVHIWIFQIRTFWMFECSAESIDRSNRPPIVWNSNIASVISWFVCYRHNCDVNDCDNFFTLETQVILFLAGIQYVHIVSSNLHLNINVGSVLYTRSRSHYSQGSDHNLFRSYSIERIHVWKKESRQTSVLHIS